MKKLLTLFVVCVLASLPAFADVRFEAISFKPAPEGGDYFSIHESGTLGRWRGHMGFYLDYSNRPLQFTGKGDLSGQRQSIIDHMITANFLGAVGLTDWWTVGANVPVVAYNWYYSDNPLDNPTAEKDAGADMADIQLMMKLRFLDADKYKLGIALVPYMTLPTGNPERYTGSGKVTGGAKVVADYKFSERFSMALNFGALFREGFTRDYTFDLPGGVTSSDSLVVDDQFTYGGALNFKATKSLQIIAEAFGSTFMEDAFAKRASPFEAGGGVRKYIGDSGLAISGGGTIGVLDGIGKPRFRLFAGLNWYTPERPPCPVCKEVEPVSNVTIVNNKIVLWGKIFYDTAKATIKPESYPVLDDVVDVINANPDIKLVEIQGHTDWRGSDAYNLDLSQRRAQAAVDYLIKKGVASERLTAVGYGESMPIADNNTVEGMTQNRRTEFIIKETYSGKVINTNGSATSTTETVETKPTDSKEPATPEGAGPNPGN